MGEDFRGAGNKAPATAGGEELVWHKKSVVQNYRSDHEYVACGVGTNGKQQVKSVQAHERSGSQSILY